MQKTLSERHKRSLRFAEANMRFEGFIVPPAVKKDCKRMLAGEVTSDQLVALYLAPFKKE